MENSDYLVPIVLGIVSSLVATLILLSLAELFRRLVIPWVADKIYRGVRIDGSWKVHAEETGLAKELSVEFEIKQWGDKISGTCFTEDGKGKTLYRINGVLKNMYLMAYMDPVSSRAIDASAILFRVEHRNHALHLRGSLLHQSETESGKVGCWDGLVFVQRSL
jgi:hypothetical protein